MIEHRMDRYFTFFLYGKRPSETPAVLEFVDWLTESTCGSDNLHVIARAEGAKRDSKSLIQGSFTEYRGKLDQLALGALNISSLKRTGEGAEFFFRYESPPQGPKTITFSLRLNLWGACERSGVSAELLRATERLFVDHDCLYGYGHPTYYVIPGRFSLIRANSQPGVPRIVDFDYTRYVEDVYRYNYLSQAVVLKIDERRLREDCTRIEVRDILAPGRARFGLAIYLALYSSVDVVRVRDCFRRVLWPEQGANTLALGTSRGDG
jgi:hypothetical protein